MRTPWIARPSRGEPAGDGHDRVRGALGVVGVDQQRRVARTRPHEGLECARLVGMGLHVRVCHRAEQGNAERAARGDGRGAREPGEIGGPRRQQAGFGAVCAAQAEVDQHAPGRRQRAADRLAGNERLEVQQVDRSALHQLRLAKRRGDAHDRLVGEEHRAFGHRVDVAGERELGERIDERSVEAPARREPRQVVRVEVKRRQVVDELGEPRGHEEAAPGRHGADEELEGRAPVHALGPIGLEHRELVQVGQQDTLRGHRTLDFRDAPEPDITNESATTFVPAGPSTYAARCRGIAATAHVGTVHTRSP